MIFATLICTFAKLYRTGSQIYMFLRNIVPVHRVIPYRYVSSQYCTSSQIYRFMFLRNIVPVHRFTGLCFFAILYPFTNLYRMFLRNILSVQRFICFFANCTSSEIYTFLRNILSVSSSAMLHRSLSYICNFATVAIQLSNVSRSLTTGMLVIFNSAMCPDH